MKGNKVPPPPKDFEYFMWSENGKFFVRIKDTEEVVEVNDDVKKYLRKLERDIRREEDKEREFTVTSELDLDILMANFKYRNPETYVLRKLDWEDVISKLTDKQYAVFLECFILGLTYKEHGKNVNRTASTICEHAQEVRKKINEILFDIRLCDSDTDDA